MSVKVGAAGQSRWPGPKVPSGNFPVASQGRFIHVGQNKKVGLMLRCLTAVT